MKKRNSKHVVIKNKVLQTLSKKINEGGVTYNPFSNKDYSGTRNIAISPFPERSQVFKGKATGKRIANYCNKNNDLLQNNFALGGWFDENSENTYLDITAPIPLEKESEAINLGRNANQIAGFNLFEFSEIQIGGTGEFNSIVSPFQERLNQALNLIN